MSTSHSPGTDNPRQKSGTDVPENTRQVAETDVGERLAMPAAPDDATIDLSQAPDAGPPASPHAVPTPKGNGRSRSPAPGASSDITVHPSHAPETKQDSPLSLVTSSASLSDLQPKVHTALRPLAWTWAAVKDMEVWSALRQKTGFFPKTYTFDDVMLIPLHNDCVDSRATLLQKGGFTTLLTRNLSLSAPIVPSNMEFCGPKLMRAFLEIDPDYKLIMRRFEVNENDWLMERKDWAGEFGKNMIVSIGIKRDTGSDLQELIQDLGVLFNAGVPGVCIDVAQGDNYRVLKLTENLKKAFPDQDVILGNIGTRSGYRRAVSAGADAVKVGIGPGSPCSTRGTTGVGLPQMYTLASIWPLRMLYGVPVIADGGIRNSDDMAKALVYSDTVMTGKLLAAVEESDAKRVSNPIAGRPDKVEYRGQASREFMEEQYGPLRNGITPEGIAMTLQPAGPLHKVVGELLGGLASTLSYAGSPDLPTFRKRARLAVIPHAAQKENAPRPD